MEHLFPFLNLLNVKKLLNNKFTGIIEVPNFDMILDKKLVSEITLDHLIYFTKKSFNNTLARMGFNVISISSTFNNYILCAEVKINQSMI